MAGWTMTVPTRSVDGEGTAVIVAEISDTEGPQGTLTVRLTADRALSVLWEAADGADGLANFQAWER